MIEFYGQIKWVHIAAVIASGSLFLLRGIEVQAGARQALAAPLRYLSYAIDTTLLTAALMLVTILPGAMFGNGWLAMKLCLLVVYVVLGTFALKRGRTPRTQLLCFVAALAVYAFIAIVAIEHHPLGMLHPLPG